jgi:hypothetical protein
MTHWFEDLTKTLADEKMGRRAAIRRVAGTVVGVAVAGVLPGTVQAKQNKHCPFGGCEPCGGGECVGCQNNPNQNCFCFVQSNSAPVCGCNSLCSQISPCSAPSQCKRGFACIVGTACDCPNGSGTCVPRCRGKHKNCQIGSGYGLTVTGRVV